MGMKAQDESPQARKIAQAIFEAPYVLLAYTAFVVIVVFADFLILPWMPESFFAHLFPYTGGSVARPYAFTLFFACMLIFEQERRANMRKAIMVILLSGLVFGIYKLSNFNRPNFGNPYLTISLWQPLWTTALPLFWILLLFTPKMNRYCRPTILTTR
jgi:hypothetical protein